MKYNHSYWDSRVVNTSSSTLVTLYNDHTAVATGHYGDFLGLPAAGLLFVAAVFTILSIPDSPPALLSVIADLYHRIAAFSDLWTMQPSPGGLTQTPPLSPRPFLVSTAFFCLGTVRHFAGTPAVALPLRRRVGRSLSRPPSRAPFYPSRHAHDCPRHAAVATRSSPPASPLRWAPVIVFFCYAVSSRRRPVGVAGISSPPSCRIMGALLGEPLRSLRLYQAPPPLAYSFAPPLWDEPLTSTLPGLIGTSYPPLRCLDSSTSPLVPTPRLHLRTVAGALAK